MGVYFGCDYSAFSEGRYILSDYSAVVCLMCGVSGRTKVVYCDELDYLGDDGLEEANGKVVSLAIKQVLSRKVEYRLEE